MRVAVDYRSASVESYKDFCKRNPSLSLSIDEWRKILYLFNESFRDYILETGDKAKFPYGIGDFSISKKYRRKRKGKNDEFMNLPIDWKRTKERGKLTYNFNFHTEGYFFGWRWFKNTSRIKFPDLWYFKPSRVTSRLLAHYIKINDKYQHLYKEWDN